MSASRAVASVLSGSGFTVVAGPFEGLELDAMIHAFEVATASAPQEEVRSGRQTIRVNGLLSRVPALSAIFTHEPVLAAAAELIGAPFKLSAFHARSVRPGATGQELHQDVEPGADGWPLLGFIFMIDSFEVDNGATRFLPGSQSMAALSADAARTFPQEQHACGPAGSMILFDGSIWHGHGANLTGAWRRSVQGALIPKGATGAIDYPATLPPDLWSGLSPLVQSLLLP